MRHLPLIYEENQFVFWPHMESGKDLINLQKRKCLILIISSVCLDRSKLNQINFTLFCVLLLVINVLVYVCMSLKKAIFLFITTPPQHMEGLSSNIPRIFLMVPEFVYIFWYVLIVSDIIRVSKFKVGTISSSTHFIN